jgi:hypothetical protein
MCDSYYKKLYPIELQLCIIILKHYKLSECDDPLLRDGK